MPGADRYAEFADILREMGAEAQAKQDAGRELLEEARRAQKEGRFEDAKHLLEEAKTKRSESEPLPGEVLRQIKVGGDAFGMSTQYPSAEAYDDAFRRSLWQLADAGDSGIQRTLETLAQRDAWWARPS